MPNASDANPNPNPNPNPKPDPNPNQVLVPNASDASLLQKMAQQHKAHAAFKPLPRAQGEGFSVSHFAGPVGYHIDDFVEKSRDALPGELALLCNYNYTCYEYAHYGYPSQY